MCCDHTSSAPRIHQLLKTISILASDHLVVPFRTFLYGTRNTIKRVGGKNKEQTNNMAWVSTKCKKRSYVTLHSLCICRLTLAWISSKISTMLLGMPTHLDWSSLTAAGLYLMPTGLFCCPVSTANCPSPSPVANSFLSAFLFPTLLSRVPLPTSGCVEISSPKPFVWFRANTDKGIVCSADHLHSVTVPQLRFKLWCARQIIVAHCKGIKRLSGYVSILWRDWLTSILKKDHLLLPSCRERLRIILTF